MKASDDVDWAAKVNTLESYGAADDKKEIKC